VSRRFEELDRRSTTIGEITLRRRLEPTLQVDVYEMKLGDEFLMSSLFTVSETALAELALGRVDDSSIDVLVGGLGLGYTARTALQDPRVRSVWVVEALSEVIEWHHRHLIPLGRELTSDPRCRFVHGDFFARLAAGPGAGFGAMVPRRFHAVVVDIDHSPRHLLHASHARLYATHGLAQVAALLHPGGVFALWSDASPDPGFIARLRDVFESCEAHVVGFPNFYTGQESTSTIYLAKC
jgi:spermidine synthase